MKHSSPYVSVIIKALNEEEKISRCIESVFEAMQSYDYEVILADSISTDKTVEIATNYPIKIVQLANIEDRSCGAAAQLGYQYCRGDYILLLDGDMELSPDFVPAALAELEQHRELAGVSGLIIDRSIRTYIDKHRIDYYQRIHKPVDVVSLGGGGLYRRACIDSVGYFSHSKLAACEELELGVRLKSKGYRLQRIPNIFSYHTGHQESNLESCRRKWNNGRLAAYGYFIKGSFGKPWFWLSLRNCWFLFVVPFIFLFSFLLGLATKSFYIGAICFTAAWAVIALTQAARKKSISRMLWGIFSWWLLFLAAVRPLLKRESQPRICIESKVIKTNEKQEIAPHAIRSHVQH